MPCQFITIVKTKAFKAINFYGAENTPLIRKIEMALKYFRIV